MAIELFNDRQIELATATPNYVPLFHAYIQRITDRKSRGIYCLRRFDIKRVRCFPKRTGVAIRCSFGYRAQDTQGASKDNPMPQDRAATIYERMQGLYIQHKKVWGWRVEKIIEYGFRFICFGLFGYEKSWLLKGGRYANDYKHTSRSFKGESLRRERNSRLQKCFAVIQNQNTETNFNSYKTSYFYSQQNAPGGVQTL